MRNIEHYAVGTTLKHDMKLFMYSFNVFIINEIKNKNKMHSSYIFCVTLISCEGEENKIGWFLKCKGLRTRCWKGKFKWMPLGYKCPQRP